MQVVSIKVCGWLTLLGLLTIVDIALASSYPGKDSYCTLAYRHKRKVWVKTSQQLSNAIRGAKAGDMIYMADGTYHGAFEFRKKKGNKWRPITLCGSRKAVIDGKGRNVGLLVHKSEYVNVVGITVKNASKGIRLETAKHCTLDRAMVTKTHSEAIHIQYRSHYNTVQNCTVTNTGRRKKQVGEGIYLGSSRRNTPRDICIGNKILYNKIGPGVTAEPIDVKENSKDGYIIGNYLDGKDLCGCPDAVSLINVKGNGYRIENNVGKNAMQDFFKTSKTIKGQGRNNVFKANKCLGTIKRGYDCTRRPGGGNRGNKFYSG